MFRTRSSPQTSSVMERSEFEQWRSKEVARLLALVETERRYYQEIVAALPVALAVLSGDKSLVWANRSFRRLFGLRAEDVRRKEISQLIPIPALAEWIDGTRSQGAVMALEVAGQPARLAAIPVRTADDDGDGETLLMLELGVLGAAQNLAPGSKLEITAASPSALVPADLPAIVWTADAESTDFRTVAGAAEEFLGYPLSHWMDRPGFFEERIHPDDRASVMEVYRHLLERGGDGSAEFRAITASGQSFWCRESIRVKLADGVPLGITGVLTDISRRKQMEQQLLSTGRLEAVQALAGRLAHDLNNPLMIIHGYSEELLESLEPSHPLRGDAQEIVTATSRISALTGKLTELTRKQAQPAQPVNVGDLMGSLQSRLAQVAGKARVEMIPTSSPVWANADSAQLGDVILILASAQLDTALDRTRLAVSCDIDRISERLPIAPLPAGLYARITLRDDGRGLDATQLAAVFDPVLHPSKPEGLDLARAHSLIRQWGGDIACSSERQQGTSFSVYLPVPDLHSQEPVGAAAAAVQPQPVPAVEPERETILVVDDEAGIRGLMRKILKRERYVVIEAASAEDALQKAAEHGGTIHLLLTDVMLPGMLGPELARKLYALDPTLKVLYISGYTQDESVRAGEYPPGARFLPKPFTLGALLGKVRETLDS